MNLHLHMLTTTEDGLHLYNSGTFVGFNCLPKKKKLGVTGDSVMISVHNFPYYRSQIHKILYTSHVSANFRTIAAIFIRIDKKNSLLSYSFRTNGSSRDANGHTEKYKYYMTTFFDSFHVESNSVKPAYFRRTSYKNSGYQ